MFGVVPTCCFLLQDFAFKSEDGEMSSRTMEMHPLINMCFLLPGVKAEEASQAEGGEKEIYLML